MTKVVLTGTPAEQAKQLEDARSETKVTTFDGYARAETGRHVKTVVPTTEIGRWLAARLGLDANRVLRCTLELNPGEVLAATLVVTLSREDLRELGFEEPQTGPMPETMPEAGEVYADHRDREPKTVGRL